jgi:ribosomal protein S18 acetylase RimI-like enzyme
MDRTTIALRPAMPDDADALAELVNFAGDGLPLHLWGRMANPGESAWTVGRNRARRDEGAFSWRNAVVAEIGNRVAACVIGYPLTDEPEPIDLAATPPMFVPLQELENRAAGSWYVNVLAAYPEFRGLGIGTKLLAEAEDVARDSGRSRLSIIVSDDNPGARRLYERCGYVESASLPMVKSDWINTGENWVLLTK